MRKCFRNEVIDTEKRSIYKLNKSHKGDPYNDMLIALKNSNFTFEVTFLRVDNKTFVLILKSAVAVITRFSLCLLPTRPTVLPKCLQLVWLCIILFIKYISSWWISWLWLWIINSLLVTLKSNRYNLENREHCYMAAILKEEMADMSICPHWSYLHLFFLNIHLRITLVSFTIS